MVDGVVKQRGGRRCLTSIGSHGRSRAARYSATGDHAPRDGAWTSDGAWARNWCGYVFRFESRVSHRSMAFGKEAWAFWKEWSEPPSAEGNCPETRPTRPLS